MLQAAAAFSSLAHMHSIPSAAHQDLPIPESCMLSSCPSEPSLTCASTEQVTVHQVIWKANSSSSSIEFNAIVNV